MKAAARRAVACVFALAVPRSHGLRILTYHRVNPDHPHDRLTVHPEAFAAQMDLLKRSGRPVVLLSEMVPALRGEAALPSGAVALTFDDGYRDNLHHAAPLLERLGLRATVFVVTDLMGSAGTLDRYAACCDKDAMLSWDEVRTLRDRGHEIGGHGRSHRELATLSSHDVRGEADDCARALEAELGRRPPLFCYPRGSESDAVRRVVREAGYAAACTVRPGANAAGVDLMGLRRTEISGDDSLADFRLKLDGAFDAWHGAVQALRSRRVP